MNLLDAFEMGQREIVAIVGGGGKTTLLYRLGRETVAAGGRAIITGTTRFTPPPPTPPLHGGELPYILAEMEDVLLRTLETELARSPLVVAGAGWGNKGRIMPVDPELLFAMAQIPGVTAVIAEADGSAGRPFKAPAEHEPVVAPSTTLLLTVVGMDVLGRPLSSERVHRPEIVAKLTGAAAGAPVDEAMVAGVLLHEQGGRKGLPPEARWIPVLNKVDTDERLAAARRIAARLLAGGAERVVIARAVQTPPVVEVVTQAGPS